MGSMTCRLPPPCANGAGAYQSLCTQMQGHGRNAMAQLPQKDKQGCNATSRAWTKDRTCHKVLISDLALVASIN